MARFQFHVNQYFSKKFQLSHHLIQEFLSEFAGTFLFLLVGVGCVIQFKTSGNGTFLSVNLGWGFAVMFGGGLGIGLSGGQLNPAVTVAQWILGRKTVSQVFVYSLAQLTGSFGGSALAYANYQEAINNFDGGHRVARGVNASLCFLVTCPAPYMTQYAGILDQIIGTAILTATMAGAIDTRNGVPQFLHPIFGGFSVMMIGMSYGVNDGYPINPARDLGARLFAVFIYGKEAFTDRNYWFWIPIVGPLLGGVIGALFYNVCFGFRSLNKKEIDKERT